MFHHEKRRTLVRGSQAHWRKVKTQCSSKSDPHAKRDIDAASDRIDSISQTRATSQPGTRRVAAPPLGHRHCATGIDPPTRDKHSRRNTTSATLAHAPHPRHTPRVHRARRPGAYLMLPLSTYNLLHHSLLLSSCVH